MTFMQTLDCRPDGSAVGGSFQTFCRGSPLLLASSGAHSDLSFTAAHDLSGNEYLLHLYSIDTMPEW